MTNIKQITFFLFLFLPVTGMAAAPAKALTLSAGERQWLQTNPTVKFTGDPNWLPYEAFDSKGNYIGIVAEHLSLIARMTGLEFNMSPSKTWTESTLKAKQGLVDVLSETDDSDLKSHLNFTIPYLSNPIVIAMHNSENYVEGINNIKHRKIALIKDYGYASKIRRKYSTIKFVTVDDIHDGLVAVSTGEIDALLCTLALCSYTIAELGLNNVRITGKTEFDTKLALGVQKNLPELLSILNKAINKISQEQQQLISDHWIKDKFADRTDYTLVYQVIVIAIALLAIFAFWNRRLSHEINLRSVTEKELKSAEEVLRLSHQRLSFHREHTPLGVIEWNTNFQVLSWNQAAENIFGYTKEEMQQPHATKNILPINAREAVDEVWGRLLENKGGTRSRNENITKDGRTILCEWYNTPLIGADGKVIGVASLVDDITERTLSEKMIWEQANFDMLTGLPNRNMFHDRLAQEMMRADRDRISLALLLIDLDQFKEVNDALGHDVGDELLKEAGRRISDCVRTSDTVARLGGDEFTIILPELHDNSFIETLTLNIIQKLEEEYHLANETIHISGSIGITLYPNDASDIDTLIKNADQAMYAAKKKGRHCFSYFTQSLQDAAQNRLRLTNDLRSALNEKQFEVYFQPIIDLKTDLTIKAEALVRWHHPERGLVSPLEFIHLAEETGLINKISEWVFTQSVQKAKQWSNQFVGDFQMSVNMSPVQFKQDTSLFISEWQTYIQGLEISGQNIIVEITEGLLLNAEPDVIDKLLWLRDAGIQVAIDDFGTGYSSLSYLKKFDIDYLKIDKSFISNLESNVNDITLCNAIIVMAHTLGLKVIAEGVETEGQKKILADAGCDFAQGYLFSKPVPADEFETILNSELTDG
jgi:diguanylate cyclase (GGDEF)-like protein/PAS domain S-box-containing protein